MKRTTRSAITTVFLVCASTVYAAGAGNSGRHDERLCIPVDGTVSSTFDSDCHIIGNWPATLPEGTDQLLALLGANPADVCFAIKGEGKAKFSGFSGLTAVLVANQVLPGATTTPLIFPTAYSPPPDQTPIGVRAGLSVFTSQAKLTGRVKDRSGTLYTKDTGAIIGEGFPGQGMVGQVLKIVGGTGDFEDASGTIAVAGQEVGGAAFYTGEVCVKRK